MSEINYFKVFILYSDDVIDDMDHLYVKRIHLVIYSYIVIKNQSTKYVQYIFGLSLM
jgi:hypothetical protein